MSSNFEGLGKEGNEAKGISEVGGLGRLKVKDKSNTHFLGFGVKNEN